MTSPITIAVYININLYGVIIIIIIKYNNDNVAMYEI